MSQQTLEDRVTALERTVARILARPGEVDKAPIATVPEDAWEQTIGIFAGDPLFDRIIEEGQRIRQADRANDE